MGLGVDLPIQGRFGFRTGLNFEKIGTNIDTRYGFLHLAEGAKAYNIAMFFMASDTVSDLDI